MRVLLQRAADASVSVDGALVGGYSGLGLVALVGVTHSDSAELARRLADKLFDLRIFDAEVLTKYELVSEKSAEQSASDLGLPVLVISQFTLYAGTKKGRRPTWDAAAPAQLSEPIVSAMIDRLRARGAIVTTGVFGAHMDVTLTNVGPMTVVLDVTGD